MAGERQRDLHSGHEGSAVAQRHDAPPVQHERPEDWGWHHEFRAAAPVLGVAMTISLLLFIAGNHEGNVENLWLVGIAAIMVFLLIRDRTKRRNSWRS
ncbi:DUF2631 domain-containing protein [soil metagenome]